MNIDPVSGYRPHDPHPAQQPVPPPTRNRDTARRTAVAVCTIADIAAGLLGLWIALHLLDANRSNGFVEFVHGSADLLSGWARDIFTMDTESLRVILNYGLPAVLYLLLGHGIAARLNRA